MTEIAGELVGGRYRLVEPVGQGAMGRVWHGRDETLGRDVAVKELLIPDGMVAGQREQLVARVLREARSAARLNHPGIITVHSVVERDGVPLIVMEFVTGRSLGAILAEDGRLPPEQVAKIGIAMAEALREAHRAGIVHRDLKPDNVLVTGERTVITDFGIASLVGDPALTSPGTVLGTPSFMSPEQIEGAAVSPACDLWSLGATLYAAVEGTPPFTGPTLAVLFHAILTRDPRRCAHAGPLAPVLTALLAKNPGLRPNAADTVRALAALDWAPGKPRRRTVLLAGLGTLTAAAVPATLILTGSPGTPGTPKPSGTPTPVRSTSATLTGHTDEVHAVAFSPDGATLASGGFDETIRLWDVADGTSVATLKSGRQDYAGVGWLAFSPDGKTLAAAADSSILLWDVDSRTIMATFTIPLAELPVSSVAFSPDGKTLASGSTGSTVTFWNLASRAKSANFKVRNAEAQGSVLVAFSPDGRTLASGSDTSVQLWDAARGTELATLTTTDAPSYGLAFSPDGKILAATPDGAVKFWDVASRTLSGGGSNGFIAGGTLTFSPDSKSIVTENDKIVEVWKVADRSRIATFKGHTGLVSSSAFSPDGRTVASGGNDHTVRLWTIP